MRGSIFDGLLNGIDYLINKAIERAPYDKIKNAKIIEKNSDDSYMVLIDENKYRANSLNNSDLQVDAIVKVMIPQNNYNDMFILNGGYAPQPDPRARVPETTVSLIGDYASSIGAYGWGVNSNGTLTIWATSNTTAEEHINFVAGTIIGTKGVGWDITNFDTSDPINVPYACTISGLSNYKSLNIILNANDRSTIDDYITLTIGVSGIQET